MSRKERILARPYNTSNNYKKKRYMFLRYKLLRMQQILVEEVSVLTPNRTPARVEAKSWDHSDHVFFIPEKHVQIPWGLMVAYGCG